MQLMKEINTNEMTVDIVIGTRPYILGEVPKTEACYLVSLHHYPHLIKKCCRLLNSEWSRSETARIRSLKASSDSLPVSLVLTTEDLQGVIGYCKISGIASKRRCFFMESVIVDQRKRGQGFGRILVEGVESFCKHELQCRAILLATMGQEGFYQKMGYEFCPPVMEFEALTRHWQSLQNSNKRYMRKFL